MTNEVKLNIEECECVRKLIYKYTRSLTCWNNVTSLNREDVKSLTSETPKAIVNSKIYS